MICAGIDAGSRAIKIVFFDEAHGRMIASGVRDQGAEQNALACRLFDEILHEADIEREQVARIVSTGYGRNAVSMADMTVTEITCHAVGVRHHATGARTIIDIGGQDSKVIHINGNNAVQDFAMNDRCAAGTGRFLEVVASRLGIPLDRLGESGRSDCEPITISSMCVVFAETEIVGLLATGIPPEDIVAGVRNSVALRIAAMAGRKVAPPVFFSGGVARIPGMDVALESVLGQPVSVVPDPQLTGALGAALMASQSLAERR